MWFNREFFEKDLPEHVSQKAKLITSRSVPGPRGASVCGFIALFRRGYSYRRAIIGGIRDACLAGI
jgi:hypothetical protein